MRLIDADALMKDLEKWMKQVDPTHPQENNAIPPLEDIIVSTLMTIEEQPTIEERKRGEWVWLSSTYDRTPCEMRYMCSECHHETILHSNESSYPWEKYCPHCGAQMEGTT